MARIRCIKPEFPQSESVGKLTRDARLLFILLWTIVDDEGRSRGASRMLASLLYPFDNDAPDLIDGWLDELERQGHVRRYVVEDSTYLDIPKWLKHQRIDHPGKSRIPSFSETFARVSRVLPKVSHIVTPDLGPRSLDRSKRLGEEESKEDSEERSSWNGGGTA